jgi:hypothetical protein
MRSAFRAIIGLQIVGIQHVPDLDEPYPNHQHMPRGAAYNMSLPVRSKKMASFELSHN